MLAIFSVHSRRRTALPCPPLPRHLVWTATFILRRQPLTTRAHGALSVYMPLRIPSRSSANLLPWLITALCLT